MNISKRILLVASLLLISLSSALAEDDGATFSLTLAQDPAFGFYPTVAGSIPISDNSQFTFYGVYWTQDALGGNLGGLNLLTEFGAGINFTLADGALNINPALGFAHGNYQSGGGRPVIADNIVPSIFVAYAAGNFSASLGAIYWKSFRNEAKVTPLIDLIDYNFNVGIALSKYFTVGLFYDHLLYGTDNSNQTEDSETELVTSYFWVGPMCKINFKSNASVMFTFGPDLVDQFNDDIESDMKKIKDYYKLSTTISF